MRRFLANGGLSAQEKPLWRLYPTTLRLPLWVRPLTLPRALRTFKISEPRVRVISREFIEERGLVRSLLAPTLRPTLDPARILDQIKIEKPLVSGEVVEWMQISGAENAVLMARIQEYNRLGSEMIGKSSDPWLPGLYIEDIFYPSGQTGAGIRTRGYAIARTPRGDFNVPSLSKRAGVFRDLLSWGSISSLWSHQWTGTLAKWKSLAETPIRQVVGFYKDWRGNVAPNFFVQRPTRPALTVRGCRV